MPLSTSRRPAKPKVMGPCGSGRGCSASVSTPEPGIRFIRVGLMPRSSRVLRSSGFCPRPQLGLPVDRGEDVAEAGDGVDQRHALAQRCDRSVDAALEACEMHYIRLYRV